MIELRDTGVTGDQKGKKNPGRSGMDDPDLIGSQEREAPCKSHIYNTLSQKSNVQAFAFETDAKTYQWVTNTRQADHLIQRFTTIVWLARLLGFKGLKAETKARPKVTLRSQKTTYGRENVRKPTIDETILYFHQIGGTAEDAHFFHDYFESNGWKVGGKAPMKNWQASARNWMRRQNKSKPMAQRYYQRQDEPERTVDARVGMKSLKDLLN